MDDQIDVVVVAQLAMSMADLERAVERTEKLAKKCHRSDLARHMHDFKQTIPAQIKLLDSALTAISPELDSTV